MQGSWTHQTLGYYRASSRFDPLRIAKPLNEYFSPYKRKGSITRYAFVLSSEAAITAYLFNSMAALIAGFKVANGEDSV